jgi:hypothetical protein
MIEEAVTKLIEFLQTASPMVWETLIKQVYVEAYSQIAWGVILLLVGCFMVRTSLVCYKKLMDDDDDFWGHASMTTGLLSVLCFLFMAVNFFSGLKQLANPQFYAIKYIIDQIK